MIGSPVLNLDSPKLVARPDIGVEKAFKEPLENSLSPYPAPVLLPSRTSENPYPYIDLKHSKGNFFKDREGNTILDLDTQNYGLSLGYNNLGLRYSLRQYRDVAGRALPDGQDLEDLVHFAMMPIAPKGLTEVHFSPNAQAANNDAVLTAFKKYSLCI